MRACRQRIVAAVLSAIVHHRQSESLLILAHAGPSTCNGLSKNTSGVYMVGKRQGYPVRHLTSLAQWPCPALPTRSRHSSSSCAGLLQSGSKASNLVLREACSPVGSLGGAAFGVPLGMYGQAIGPAVVLKQ